MAVFNFECPPHLRCAGCVEKVVIRTPFVKAKINPQTRQQMYHPQTRQPLAEPDAAAAWQWLNQQNLPLVPGVSYQGAFLSQALDVNEPPTVVTIQLTQPTVQHHAPIHAPYGQPVGNSGAPIGMPPQAGPEWRPGMPVQYRADPFEQLDNTALPGGSDSMLGDVDPTGGTFTDIDTMGNETQRVDIKQYDPSKIRK